MLGSPANTHHHKGNRNCLSVLQSSLLNEADLNVQIARGSNCLLSYSDDQRQWREEILLFIAS